ncbi:unnamed protein product [Cladocopium goreaui]|uniref:PABC domain-containing protein n=1 Tax=Cladocopium goreaui TaxID=2562237 RepID=A0A9P1DIP0_9DINO|nr:unnamed protein product [Cladocopium goreaui]
MERIELIFGRDWVKKRLNKWRWTMSTAFTGVGCAEIAALSLQAAARRFAPESGASVHITSACEIDKSCQKVLLDTFDSDQCIFPDITKIDMNKGKSYCVRHQCMCELQPEPHEDCMQVSVGGPVCVHYSPMGNREKEGGAQHVTHKSYYREIKKSKTKICVVENVPEYTEEVVQKELGGEWMIESARVDPRIFGLPCCRTRVFMICYKWREVRWVAPFTLSSFLGCLRQRVVMTAANYFYKSLPKSILSASAAANLKCYNEEKSFGFPDLNQLCKNGRARGETKDKCLQTLTTNSGRIYSQGHGRYIEPEEALSSHVLPMTDKHAKICKAPKVQMGEVSRTAKTRMAGNAMNVPCIGAVLLAAVLGLDDIAP